MSRIDCWKLVGRKERVYLQQKALEHEKTGLSKKEAGIKAARDYHVAVLDTLESIYKQTKAEPVAAQSTDITQPKKQEHGTQRKTEAEIGKEVAAEKVATPKTESLSIKEALEKATTFEEFVENLHDGKPFKRVQEILGDEVIGPYKRIWEKENPKQEPQTPKEVAKSKLQALVDSGDLEKTGTGYKILTDKGGKELKAISESLKTPENPEEDSASEEYVPKDGWENNLMKAREYALKLSIDIFPKTGIRGPSKSLEELVLEINQKISGKSRIREIADASEGRIIIAGMPKTVDKVSFKKTSVEKVEKLKRYWKNKLATYGIDLDNLKPSDKQEGLYEEYLQSIKREESYLETPVQKAEPETKKSDKKFEKAHQKLAELDELLRPGRVNIDEEFDKDRAQKIIIKAGEVVAAYIDAGTTRFAEMMQDIFKKYGESGVKTFLDPMKKGYGSILASAEDIENMDDIKTVRASKVEDFTTKKVDNDDKIVDEIAGLIGTEKLDKRKIESIGEKYGVTDKNKVKELAELAVVQKARELAHNDDFKGLVKLYEDQPNLTHRTNESIDKQQYSTPAPLGYLVGKYVLADKPGTKFEPSAGNGMLTIAGDPEAFTVNEIDDVRRANLEKQGFGDITAKDGSKDFNTPKEYDAVVTNPPFGGTEEVRIDGYKLTELAQIMSIRALDTMKDDGKAAIIIGGNSSFDSEGRLKGRDRIYFNYLFNKYNVEDVIDISGDIYRKQGASFPIRVILINGRKAAPEGVAPTKEWFGKQEKDFAGIQERIKQTGYENIQSTELGGKRESDPLSGSTTRGVAPQKGSTPNVPGEKVSKPGERVQRKPKPVNRGTVTDTGAVNEGDTRSNLDESAISTTPIGEGLETSGEQSQSEGVEGDIRGQQPKRDRTRTVGSSTGELTAPYKPSSSGTPFNVSSPAALQQEIEDAKRDLEGDVGNIDEFVKNKLGYKSIEEMHKGLSAEQVDGVALAIRNIERGTGIIIGDQPGIGKGRQAAAIIRYANKQGKKPIFLTKSAYLFSALYDDLNGIGYGNPKPFIVNATDNIVDGDGNVLWRASSLKIKDREIPSDAKVILATYSQFQNPRHSADKVALLKKLAQDNIVIMDESHMASGDESNTSALFQEILPTTKGVVYLSGTYAKRASSMPVYATKTSMNEANIDPGELIDAITKGGNPLQEITASNLTEAGEMIRRERPFKGIEIATHVIGGDNEQVGKKQREQADSVTGIMRELIDFQVTHINPAVKKMDAQTKAALKITSRKGTQLGGVSNSPYFQKVFNVVNQLLYAIKAQDIADLVIAEAKAGRKPFIAIKGTMESMLNDMISRGELAVGDPIKADFSFVLQKGLEGLFRITSEDAQGNKIKSEIPVSALSEEGQKEYRYLKSKIANLKSGLTLSPIDLIIDNLEKAGLKVAEVTGRKMRVSHKDGGTYLETNKKLKTNEAYRRYNNGEIDVLIVNRSGSTGASAQASPKFKDVRPRTMFVLENELDISELVQILFRINRSGQIHLPKYVLVSSSIPAEQRLAIMTSKKLKSLDANTTSNQKQSKGLIEVPDLLNKYGDIVVHEYLQDNPEVDAEMGSPVTGYINESGDFIPNEGTANKVTGKVAVLSSDKQKAFYDDITKRYNKYIDFLNEAGMNDLVIENLPLNAKTLKKEATIIGKGGRSRFGEDTFLEEVEVNVLKKPMTKAEIDHTMKELGGDRTAEFKDALKVYADNLYAKTANEVNEKFDKKVAAIEKDSKLSPEDKEAEILAINSDRQDFLNGKQATAEGKIKFIDGLLNFFKPGRAVMIPVDYNDMRNAGVRPGIFMGFDIDVTDPKGFLPSNVTLKFAINDSRRTLTLPSSKEGIVNFIRESSYNLSPEFKENTYKDWDGLKKPKDREKRFIVTGNILQGLGNHEYRKGTIVKYTTDEGFVNTGIMLPVAFDQAESSTAGMVSVPAKKAADVINAMPIGGSIESADGDVKITRETQNKFSVRVPKPVQVGGKYFSNDNLNKIVLGGRWDSVGSSMEAFVDDSRMDEFLTALGNIFSTSFNIKKTETGNKYKPSGSSVNLEDIQRRGPVKTDVKPFNMVDRVKDVFKKHGVSINEGSLRRKYEGVYKQMTNGVRVQSMWDLFVASHEMTHAIDAKYKLVENIRKNASQKLQAEFSHAYENLYPDPKKSATLTERIEEGMAMVMEMYLIDPNQATNQYPEIVKHLFTNGGQFHKKEMTDFIDDMVELITDYQSLKPEDQINARIKWDGANKASGISVQTKVLHALTNDLITANMVDNMIGGELRAKAITPNVTMLRNISAIAGNWIRKPFGISEEPQTYVGNGNWSNKKGKYRVDDLLKKLGGVDDIIKFSDWLVARRQYFDFIKLDSIAEDINQGNIKRQEEYDSLKQIVDRNKMPLDLVEAVYYKFEAKYDAAAKIYDSINNDMIDFMEATELISSAKANEFRQSPGYASFQRFIDDEQANTDNLNLSSGSKARLGQLKARSGSSLQILPPVYSQMVAIGETLRKGQLNLVWKAWADAAKANPEVAKMFEPVVKQDMKNPNDFQVVYEKGVEKWYKLSEESKMFAHALSPDQIDLLNAFLRGASRVFQASTTQFFAPFAAMNITIDASTRFMQTKTGLIPFIHDIPTVGKAMAGMAHWMGLIDQKSPNEVEQYMSLGGRKQTLAGTLELEPLGSVEAILNKDWVHQAKRGFEKAVKIVELPVNFTEIIGRATEFKRALAKGYPTNVAMHMAANVGINFSNKGSLANNYVKSVAYMGAGIQAFSQFIKTAKNNPGRTGMAIGIMATLASTGAILVYGFGDDDEKIALSNQNPEELARFIFLPGSAFGMKSGLIKIRIPEQGGNIAAAAQLYWAHHFMDNKVQFSDIYRTQETVLPSQLRFSQGLGLAGTYLPQAISPSLQTITNTRFYPHLSPIVPDWMKDLDEYAQYDKYTSRTAKAVGEITKDSYVEVSPKKVDFFIRAQGGRSVSLLMGLTEAALYGDPVKTYINIFEESDRFLFTGRVYNKFYEMREEANQELRALTLKKNDYPISNEILNEAKGRVKLFNEVHEMLSVIGDAITQGNDVPMEQRKQMFEMLQSITKEELTNNP